MEFSLLRQKKSVELLLQKVDSLLESIGREVRIMEVCGTHTMTAYRSGLGHVLRKKGVRLISGPGCPVCITPEGVLLAAAKVVEEMENTILVSFGDMLRVPVDGKSLLTLVPAQNSSVKVIYAPEEALKTAELNPDRRVVFLATGFETTIPSIAWVVLEAQRKNMKNLFFITSLRLVPPPLRAILCSGDVNLDGFIYPGHVSVIIGSRPYEFIPEEFGVPGAVAGFEPVDLLLGVISVLQQICAGEAKVDIVYTRAVQPEGNPAARKIMDTAFECADAEWRGFGVIPRSGLVLRNKVLDASREFGLELSSRKAHEACRCGDVVKGSIEPEECPLFARTCAPESPQGPCMVSVEGSCLIHYKYGSVRWTGSA